MSSFGFHVHQTCLLYTDIHADKQPCTQSKNKNKREREREEIAAWLEYLANCFLFRYWETNSPKMPSPAPFSGAPAVRGQIFQLDGIEISERGEFRTSICPVSGRQMSLLWDSVWGSIVLSPSASPSPSERLHALLFLLWLNPEGTNCFRLILHTMWYSNQSPSLSFIGLVLSWLTRRIH